MKVNFSSGGCQKLPNRVKITDQNAPVCQKNILQQVLKKKKFNLFCSIRQLQMHLGIAKTLTMLNYVKAWQFPCIAQDAATSRDALPELGPKLVDCGPDKVSSHGVPGFLCWGLESIDTRVGVSTSLFVSVPPDTVNLGDSGWANLGTTTPWTRIP